MRLYQRAGWATCVVVAMLVAGCASEPERVAVKQREIPVFPPPPEKARFVYERTLYSSADVVDDVEGGEFERLVTGTVRTGEGLHKPYGVAVYKGKVYVGDTVRRRVAVFDIPGKRYSTIGDEDPGALRLPLGLDVDAKGTLYVADGTTMRIQIYGPDGTFLRQFGGPDTFHRPAGIGVNSEGTRLYVVDIGGVDNDHHRVRVFDPRSGTHLFDFGSRGDGPGDFNLPRDVVVAPNGLIYVVDGGNFRVQVFDGDGKFLRVFGTIGRQGGQFSRPKEIATDLAGNVYVVDSAFGNFQIFDADGLLLLDVGGRANTDAPAKYMLPSGIAVDGDGRVYMVDQFFRKVDVFRPADLAPTGGYVAKAGRGTTPVAKATAAPAARPTGTTAP
jgi:DNA-binding beta-propeller fold protein YncE